MASQYYVLIANPENEKVLVREGDHRLPCVVETKDDRWNCIYLLCDSIQRKLGLGFSLVFLREDCEAIENGCFCSKLYIFEAFDGNETLEPPPNFFWLPRDKCGKILVEPPTPDVAQRMKEYASNGLKMNTSRLFPHCYPGWSHEAAKWAQRTLAAFGIRMISIEQLHQHEEGAILLVECEYDITFYLKACYSGGQSDEVAVYSALIEVMPNELAKPVAIDKEKRLILMENLGFPLRVQPYYYTANTDGWRKVLAHWCSIQLRSVKITERLIAMGCIKCDASWLVKSVERMAGDLTCFRIAKSKMLMSRRKRYSHAEYTAAFTAYVKKVCNKISAYNIPLALVHDDLHLGNIFRGDGNGHYKYIDFADTKISFPFRDALSFRKIHGATGDDDLDFYLSMWTDYEPIERLRELLRLVSTIDEVFSLLSWYSRFKRLDSSRTKTHESALCSRLLINFDKNI